MNTITRGKKTDSNERAGSRRRGRSALIVALTAVPVVLSACSSSSLPSSSGIDGLPTSVVQGATGVSVPASNPPSSATAPASDATAPASGATPNDTTVPAAPSSTGASNGCSISAVTAITDESAAQDAQQTASWSLIQANGWTVPVPDSDWHLTASDGGFDVVSPDGGSGTDLTVWPSQTPWTLQGLAQTEFLNKVSDFQVVCSTQVQQTVTGPAQGYEFTADSGGSPIHGIVIFTLLTPTTSGIYFGQVRDLYTPTAQWSTANAELLTLINKRAIESPSAP
jgi:hypothetical protein